jgi:choice-of-anchor B domain-containing protein
MPEARLARAAYGASIALGADMAFIGAPGEGSGVVYVYRKSGSTWTPAGKITVDGGEATDRFGQAISIDGNRVAIGAPGRSTAKGAVYLFTMSGDSWKQDAMIMVARPSDNARFGTSVLFKGKQLIVGAPGAVPIAGQNAGSAGMVTLFQYSDIAEIWKERQSFTSFQHQNARFGQTLAMAGTELWIGAPASDRNTGRIFRLRPNADGSFDNMSTLNVDGVEPGSLFANAMAVSNDAAIIGMPIDAGGEGTVMFLGRTAAGAWVSRGTVFPVPGKVFAKVTGKELECGDGGKVGEFECGNTALSSFLPITAIGGKRGTRMNDNWGWTDPVTKREIAILGRTDGTSFVDVTDPSNPRYLGNLPKTKGSPSAAWRDMKVYKDHVFIVADNSGEHGMQVFDLTRLRAIKTPQELTPDVTYDRINSAHNIVSNEETGFMYTVGNSGGGETCGGGYHMVDVREPKKPKFAGCFGDPKTGRAGTGYSHDAQCVTYKGPDKKYTGREICIGSNETAISIADLTDKKNPVAISRASYPNVAYAHQAWLTDDHRYLYLDDEGDESEGKGEAAKGTRTLVWDLADLSDPVLVKEHVGTSRAIDHNLYVKGDRMFQANYTSGLRILDISDPRNPKEVGYLDTHPGDDGKPSFAGAWSVYPYFKSGTIIVTSIGEGVFFAKDRSRKVLH